MNDAFFAALVMTATNEYIRSQTQAGVAVTADEAKLFARNCTTVVRAVLDTGIELAPS
jgi:hypothetical protein